MLPHEAGESPQAAASRVLTIAWVVGAAISFCWFLSDGVARVWSGTTTDFPNYYAAAKSTLNGTPLPLFYEYPEFQREIGRAGINHQLGGYIPQTPLTMLPFLPIASLRPVIAKRLWLILNLGFISLTLWLLSRMTKFNVAQLWLVVFLGYQTFRQNFWLGQYYVFLLALMTVAAHCLLRRRERLAGATLAAVLALKLYGAPFLLFLAAKRQWCATRVFMAVLVVLVVSGIAMFGWSGMIFYAIEVLPRSLAGETLNPYHPASITFVTLFRKLLVAEPALNPHPLLDSPLAFAFVQYEFTLFVLLIPALALWTRPGPVTKTDLAWWSIALLLVSPNTASYTFVLLVLPVALLIDERPFRDWPYILVPWFFLAMPIRPAWGSLFLKAWLLLFLFVAVGWKYFAAINRKPAALMTAGIWAVASGAAVLTAAFPETPANSATPIALQPEAIYSCSPIVTSSGIFFEGIASGRYVTQRWDGARFESFGMDGNMFHPSAPDSGTRVYVELFAGTGSSIAYFDVASHRQGTVPTDQLDPHDPTISHSGRMLALVSKNRLYISDEVSVRRLNTAAPARDPAFVPGDEELVYIATAPNQFQIARIDLSTGNNTILVGSPADLAKPSISPDRRMLAYASRQTGNWQVWTKNLGTGREIQLTTGKCNSMSPAWSLDSREIIFTSDCRRGLNLPALFRMPIGVAD